MFVYTGDGTFPIGPYDNSATWPNPFRFDWFDSYCDHQRESMTTAGRVPVERHSHLFPMYQWSLASFRRSPEYSRRFHDKSPTLIYHSNGYLRVVYRNSIWKKCNSRKKHMKRTTDKQIKLHCFGLSAGVMSSMSCKQRDTFTFVLSSLHARSTRARCSLVMARSLWKISWQACFNCTKRKTISHLKL